MRLMSRSLSTIRLRWNMVVFAASLRKREHRSGQTNDLMIAAIALSRRLTLVTHNIREFSRVSGLAVEDWELP